MKQSIEITGVHLKQERRDGYTFAVVRVEVGGRWVEIIREMEDGPYSHICEPGGIEAAIARTALGSAP